jgi:hypothetical protein
MTASTESRARRKHLIATVLSAVKNGTMRFVRDPHSLVPRRYWVETRPSSLNETLLHRPVMRFEEFLRFKQRKHS